MRLPARQYHGLLAAFMLSLVPVCGTNLILYSVTLKLNLSEFTFMLNCIEKFYF